MSKDSEPKAEGIRLNAFLASAGLGSRRSVETLITQGRVRIDGEVTKDLSFRVDVEKHHVTVNSKPVHAKTLTYILLHKPSGYACTQHDPHSKTTIYELLPATMRHLQYAGRLDVASEGLVLLSNDGAWLQRIAHPRHEVLKTYQVVVEGLPSPDSIKRAQVGVLSRGEWLKAYSITFMWHRHGKSSWQLQLKQGRNREIRRIFAVLKHRVTRLVRIRVGALELGSTSKGNWRHLTSREKSLF